VDVGVAVGVDVGVALGVDVGGPASAGVVSASATPNSIRLQKSWVNRFIVVISPAQSADLANSQRAAAR
jgi:hypothetical protein